MRQTRSSGLIRHNFDIQSKYLRQAVSNYQKPEKNPSPISILDQQNIKPPVSTFAETTKRIKESFIMKDNPNSIVQPPLRKSYETGVKFFGIDYERIEQLRGKYLNRFGIRNQGLAVRSDNLENTLPMQGKTITATFGRGEDILKQTKMEIRASMELLRTGKIIHHREKEPLSISIHKGDALAPIEDSPLEFENEELTNYLRKYREGSRATSLTKTINQHNETTLMKASEINLDIEQKMRRLYEKLEEKQARKRARKQTATQSVEQPKSPPIEIVSNRINDPSIVLALEQQIRFDIEFRRLRQSIPKNQMDRILQIMSTKCPHLTKQRLQITKNEVNPFEQKKQNTSTVQQLADRLIQGYERAEKYFTEHILNQFSSDTVKSWLEQVDIDRAQQVNIGNIITHLNLKVRGQYRNRDIVRLAARLNGGKVIPKKNLLGMLTHQQ